METRLDIIEPRSLGEAVWLLMRRSGLPVGEVAESAGLTRQALYEWLWNGNGRSPRWDSIVGVARALAPALGCEPGDILADLERLDRLTSDKGLSLRRGFRPAVLEVL